MPFISSPQRFLAWVSERVICWKLLRIAISFCYERQQLIPIAHHHIVQKVNIRSLGVSTAPWLIPLVGNMRELTNKVLAVDWDAECFVWKHIWHPKGSICVAVFKNGPSKRPDAHATGAVLPDQLLVPFEANSLRRSCSYIQTFGLNRLHHARWLLMNWSCNQKDLFSTCIVVALLEYDDSSGIKNVDVAGSWRRHCITALAAH